MAQVGPERAQQRANRKFLDESEDSLGRWIVRGRADPKLVKHHLNAPAGADGGAQLRSEPEDAAFFLVGPRHELEADPVRVEGVDRLAQACQLRLPTFRFGNSPAGNGPSPLRPRCLDEMFDVAVRQADDHRLMALADQLGAQACRIVADPVLARLERSTYEENLHGTHTTIRPRAHASAQPWRIRRRPSRCFEPAPRRRGASHGAAPDRPRAIRASPRWRCRPGSAR